MSLFNRISLHHPHSLIHSRSLTLWLFFVLESCMLSKKTIYFVCFSIPICCPVSLIPISFLFSTEGDHCLKHYDGMYIIDCIFHTHGRMRIFLRHMRISNEVTNRVYACSCSGLSINIKTCEREKERKKEIVIC